MLIKDSGYLVNIDSINKEFSKVNLIGNQESIKFADELKTYAFSLQFKKIDEEVEDRRLGDSIRKEQKRLTVSSNANTSKKESYTMVLTHLLGKKLEQNAYFSVGDMSIWTLDMRNGSKIKYTITGRVGNDPMCGLTAKDNFGDVCAICIEKRGRDNVEVEFRYSAGVMTYKGYMKR